VFDISFLVNVTSVLFRKKLSYYAIFIIISKQGLNIRISIGWVGSYRPAHGSSNLSLKSHFGGIFCMKIKENTLILIYWSLKFS
jgi:hypothetical protein